MSLTRKGSLKVVFLGDSGTGKSSIITQYVHKTFLSNPVASVGASFLCVTVTVNDRKVELALWDTAGQEAYRGLTPMYYRNSVVAILVFDITSADSFAGIPNWIKEIRSNCDNNIIIVLCGNKSDMREAQTVSTEDAEKLAAEFQVPYVETSAKTGEAIGMLIELAVRRVMETRPEVLDELDNEKSATRLEDRRASDPNSQCC